MCEKCDQIDARIRQLRILISPGLESLPRVMIEAAVEALQADKLALMCSSISPTSVSSPQKPN
ncbi:hypothetical protein SE91_27850 [Bradyrhizobium sp. DOA1]|nr:hypothetical protein SE91_27850 [Bradyrhizobium sp. DOA1]